MIGFIRLFLKFTGRVVEGPLTLLVICAVPAFGAICNPL